MNTFLNPLANNDVVSISNNEISPEIKSLTEEISILKMKRMDLDIEIRDLENKLKDATGEEKETLEKTIADKYIKFDEIGEKIKKNGEIINSPNIKETGVNVADENNPFANDTQAMKVTNKI